MKVLVTGFEPFGADSINASWEAVRRLPKRTAGIDIVAKCVPVVFGDAARIVEELIERPDAVLCTGVAAGRAQVTPEYVAINHRHARIADNEGFQPYDEPVVAGAPDAYFAAAPVYAMVKACREQGIPAAVSYSAGTYCCNDLFYSVRHFAQQHYPGMLVDFIHVPQCSEQVAITGETKPSMEPATAARALEVMIETLFKDGNWGQRAQGDYRRPSATGDDQL